MYNKKSHWEADEKAWITLLLAQSSMPKYVGDSHKHKMSVTLTTAGNKLQWTPILIIKTS